jgi:purine nucleosidase
VHAFEEVEIDMSVLRHSPEKIILDCDPGHDDAVAMLLAHGNPEIELLAVTTDPEAAAIVFSAGWDVTMVGLDLTHQALATPDVVARVAGIGTGPARFVGELLEFFTHAYRDAQGFDYPPVHDPCAVAHVIDPTVVRATRTPIVVETAGAHTLGMTVADLRTPAPADCRTSAALELDRERFWDLVIDALERIGDPALDAAPSSRGAIRRAP